MINFAEVRRPMSREYLEANYVEVEPGIYEHWLWVEEKKAYERETGHTWEEGMRRFGVWFDREFMPKDHKPEALAAYGLSAGS